MCSFLSFFLCEAGILLNNLERVRGNKVEEPEGSACSSWTDDWAVSSVSRSRFAMYFYLFFFPLQIFYKTRGCLAHVSGNINYMLVPSCAQQPNCRRRVPLPLLICKVCTAIGPPSTLSVRPLRQRANSLLFRIFTGQVPN